MDYHHIAQHGPSGGGDVPPEEAGGGSGGAGDAVEAGDIAEAITTIVAPAEAGAYLSSPHRNGPPHDEASPDGPLPPQGRREGEQGLPEDDQGRRGEDQWRRGEEMRHDHPARPGARCTDFAPERRAQFLHHLAEQGSVRHACARVGIARQTAYLARRRDAVFRAGWDAAIVLARDYSEQVLANYALEGFREKVWHRGEEVGERVRFDSRLLLAHLGRLDARAGDGLAQARAERFDEILALVAGEDFPEHMADRRDGPRYEPDPLLPMERERYACERGAELEAAAVAPAPVPEWEAEELAALAQANIVRWDAQDRAAAEWDDWSDRVDAVAASLEAGELPVVTPRGEDEPEDEGGADLAAGDAPCAPAATAAGGAPEFSPRTLSHVSLCADGGGDPAEAEASQALPASEALDEVQAEIETRAESEPEIHAGAADAADAASDPADANAEEAEALSRAEAGEADGESDPAAQAEEPEEPEAPPVSRGWRPLPQIEVKLADGTIVRPASQPASRGQIPNDGRCTVIKW